MWASKKGPLIKFSLVQLLFRMHFIIKLRFFNFVVWREKKLLMMHFKVLLLMEFIILFFEPFLIFNFIVSFLFKMTFILFTFSYNSTPAENQTKQIEKKMKIAPYFSPACSLFLEKISILYCMTK